MRRSHNSYPALLFPQVTYSSRRPLIPYLLVLSSSSTTDSRRLASFSLSHQAASSQPPFADALIRSLFVVLYDNRSFKDQANKALPTATLWHRQFNLQAHQHFNFGRSCLNSSFLTWGWCTSASVLYNRLCTSFFGMSPKFVYIDPFKLVCRIGIF